MLLMKAYRRMLRAADCHADMMFIRQRFDYFMLLIFDATSIWRLRCCLLLTGARLRLLLLTPIFFAMLYTALRSDAVIIIIIDAADAVFFLIFCLLIFLFIISFSHCFSIFLSPLLRYFSIMIDVSFSFAIAFRHYFLMPLIYAAAMFSRCRH